jgi:lysine biosynthesis protein LysW
MAVSFCLDCGHSIYLGARPWEGQIIRCPNCGAELEVISVAPLELDWVYLQPAKIEEDWDRQANEDWEE